MISVTNKITPSKPIDWQRNDYSICIAIALAASFSTDAVDADAKILKQQLCEDFWWYYNCRALWSYSNTPVYFAFLVETGYVGYFVPAQPLMLLWNSLL